MTDQRCENCRFFEQRMTRAEFKEWRDLVQKTTMKDLERLREHSGSFLPFYPAAALIPRFVAGHCRRFPKRHEQHFDYWCGEWEARDER